MIYLRLFFEFFKIGLFSIGGGAATIPYLIELSKTTNWFTLDQLSNLIAVAESTPGAIGVNMATFTGFLATEGNILQQSLGATCATLGLVAPSIIIIILISFCLSKFKTNQTVGYVFYGLRPASVALITFALYTLSVGVFFNKDSFGSTYNILELINLKNILIGLILGNLMFKYKLHPIFYIIIAAIVGVILKL